MIINRMIRIICFLLFVIIALWQMYFAAQEQMILRENTAVLNLHQIRDSRILTYQAKQKHLFEAACVFCQGRE